MSFRPQQYAVLSAARPQACWTPALTATSLRAPLTAAGTLRSALEPSPSWPLPFHPQHAPALSTLTAHVNAPPAATDRSDHPPVTGPAAGLALLVRFPSCPVWCKPQRKTESPGVTRR